MLTIPFRPLVPCVLLAGVSGCFQPGYGPGYMGYPYQQPMYAPPQNLNAPQSFGAPGTLVVPQSNAPLYDPNQIYNGNPAAPSDTFTRPNGNSGTTFERDGGGVPQPKEPGGTGGSPFFDNDLKGNNTSTQNVPDRDSSLAATSASDTTSTLDVARPVSGWKAR